MIRSALVVTTFAAALTACTAANPPAPATPAMPAAAVPAPAADPAPPPAAEHVVSAADLSDHLGDSPETAVSVPKDAPNEGIDFENRWIYSRYGRFRRTSWGIASAPPNRHFKEVKIELTDHSTHTIYFDITDNWNAWKPAPK
jgi:hypothetical protein